MLKFKLTKDEHEKLSDAEKTFYKTTGEGFTLEVEGVVDKDVHDEFRANNVTLLKQQKEFEGVDLTKYNSMLETDKKIRNKELIASGDIETLLAEHTATLTADFKGKIETLTLAGQKSVSDYNTLATKTHIEGVAMKSFATHNIRPDANNAIMSQIKAKFSLDGGKAIAKNGDTIEAGANGNLTIDEFVASQPDFMRVPNTPGAGNGNNNNQQQPNGNTSSVSKIAAGLKALK